MSLPTLTLTDGRVAALIRWPKAADATKAHRIAGSKGNDIDRSAALLAQLVTIDGAPQTMEELLELELEDFNELGGMLPGKSSTPETKS